MGAERCGGRAERCGFWKRLLLVHSKLYIILKGSIRGQHSCRRAPFVDLRLAFGALLIFGLEGGKELGVKTGPNSLSETVGKRGS